MSCLTISRTEVTLACLNTTSVVLSYETNCQVWGIFHPADSQLQFEMASKTDKASLQLTN